MLIREPRAEPDSLHWRVRPGVVVEWGDDGVTARLGEAVAHLRQLSGGHRDALHRLIDRGEVGSALAEGIAAEEGTVGVAEWYFHLESLLAIGAIEWIADPDGAAIRLIPLTSRFRPASEAPSDDGSVEMSAFAAVRRDGEVWVVESPYSAARIEIPGAAFPMMTPALRRALHAAQMTAELDQDARQAGWSFHDAWFHARSRMGRRDASWGARADQVTPEPLPRPSRAFDLATRISLARAAWRDDGPSLDQVLGARRSVRQYRTAPIDIVQLGQLLDRVAADRPRDTGTGRGYPSGGGCYPLEWYLAVDRCAGLERGAYRYDPADHALDPIAPGGASVGELLDWYRGKATDALQVVLLLTCRIGVVNGRYDGIGYSLVLKEVGAVYQTLYLAATAMNLAPCALGGGDSELIARVLGTDPVSEPAVGEFQVGGR